ncbi:hypothetical protein [Colwellia sp. 20A7]|uniref:hypothetical protein n=1 Tax=Colwellia sp. 20A7 TaxID=2689569 RepID=UPI00135B4563|nr:hypothetical protein [Colwellia sp. 20A7]
MVKLLFIFILLCCLNACSNKELYQAGQDYQKSECVKNASSEEQLNDCLTRNKKTYEVYKREHDEVIEK